MNPINEGDRHQDNIEIVLSGSVERNINIATRLVPNDTFTAVSKEQFLKLINLGVEIPLKSQTDILNRVESRFVDAYAALARYTPEQIASKDGKRYPIAEQIMVTTWSFWFDYLQKLKEETAEKDSGYEVATRGGSEQKAAQVHVGTGHVHTEEPTSFESKEIEAWNGVLSKEALELVEDVWAEFEKAGMDK